MDFDALQANFRPIDLGYSQLPQAPQRKKNRFGIVGDLIDGTVTDAAKFLNQGILQGAQIYDTGRMIAADASGNTEAWKNANQAAQQRTQMFGDTGGLFNKGTITNAEETARGDFATGARKIGGTTAKLGATIAPVGKAGTIIGKVGQAGAAGAVYGGGQGLTDSGSLEDVLTGAVQGGLVGGAFGGAAGVLGKGLGKLGAGRAAAAGTSATDRGKRALLGNAWGIKPGTKIGGDVLTPQRAAELQTFVSSKMGVPKTANASMVFERAVSYADETGGAIGSAIKAANQPLGRPDVNALTKNLESKFSKVAGIDYKTDKGATQLLQQLKTVKSSDDLWQFRKALDDRINFNRNSQNPDPVFEQFARTARKEVSDKMNQLVPEVAPLNKSYSQVNQVLDLVAPAARSPRGVNLLNNRIGGAIAQRGQAFAGQSAPISGATGAIRSGASRIPTNAPEIAARGATIGAMNVQPQTDSLEGVFDQSSLGMNNSTSMSSPSATNQIMDEQYQQTPQESSPYSRENLMADIQRDPENAPDYIKYYSMLQEVFAPAEAGADMSQSSKNAMASSDNAINTVNQLEGMFNAAGGGGGRVGGFVKNLGGTVGFNEEAKVYNDMANASVTQIAKALAGSGAGTVSDMDAKVIMAALAKFNNSPAEAQAKFAALRQRLENARNNTMVYGGGGGSSLEDALLQQQSY